MKLKRYIGHFLKWGTLISTLGFVLATLIQIYARFFMEKAPSWTEEAARFFFVFAIGFSSGLAMKGNYYVHFDFLYNALNKKWQNRVLPFIYLLSAFLFMILSVYGLQFVITGWTEKSPSLKAPMGIAFVGVAIMGISIAYFALLKFISLIRSKYKSK